MRIIILLIALVIPLQARSMEECNLIGAFNTYLDKIKQIPHTDTLKEIVHWKSFLEIAKDTAPDRDWVAKKLDNSDERLLLRAENILLRSAWVDLRIYEIVKFVELCDKGRGELVLKYKTIYDTKVTEISPFVLEKDKWQYAGPYISKRSSINGKLAEDILGINKQTGSNQAFEVDR